MGKKAAPMVKKELLCVAIAIADHIMIVLVGAIVVRPANVAAAGCAARRTDIRLAIATIIFATDIVATCVAVASVVVATAIVTGAVAKHILIAIFDAVGNNSESPDDANKHGDGNAENNAHNDDGDYGGCDDGDHFSAAERAMLPETPTTVTTPTSTTTRATTATTTLTRLRPATKRPTWQQS